MLSDKYYEKHNDIKITPVSKNDVIKKLKYDNTLLSNTISEQNKEIKRLQKIIEDIESYCYISDDLYETDYDYDYEEELIVNYVPSHFKEGILNIIKGVDEDE